MLTAMAIIGAVCASGARAQGLVTGTLGVAVSPAPGQSPYTRLGGGAALGLEQVELDGQRWQHLLGSDGRHGWTRSPLAQEIPVTARAVVPGFELLPLPPGAADFLSSVGRPVPERAEGKLIGGSRDSMVSETRDQMVPAWINPSLAPWPRWSMGGVDGYAPLPLVALSWNSSAGGAGTGTRNAGEVLASLGLVGLSRAPFLTQMANGLHRLAPQDGSKAMDLSDAPGRKPRPVALQGAWQGPQCAYRPVSPPPGGLAALLCFEQAQARAFVLQGASGKTLIAHAAEDALSIVRVEEADLDGDGLPEWLLELVGIYGDGYYAELWVINGRSSEGQPRIDRQALSRSSGERPASSQDAAWGVGSDRSLWVWRSNTHGGRMSLLRYGKTGLSAITSPTPALIVLGNDDSPQAARQRQLEGATSKPGVMVLPLHTASGLRWVNAMPAISLAQAKRWATEHALPAASVRSLPWGR